MKHRGLEVRAPGLWKWWGAWTLAAVLYAALSVVIVVPEWDYGWWMLGIGVAIFLVVLFLGGVMRLTRRYWLRPRLPPAETQAVFGLHARVTLACLTLAICLVGAIVPLTLVEHAVTARSLGYHPLTTPAVAVFEERRRCTKCTEVHTTVFFKTDTAQEYVQVRMAGGDSDLRTGTPLVYDPLHPDRVMTQKKWRTGLQPHGLIGAGLTLITPFAWGGFLIVNRRRRERAFGSLRPDVAITSVRRHTRLREFWWRVTFADGKHVGYADTSSLRTALGLRVDMSDPTKRLEDVGRGHLVRTRRRVVLDNARAWLFIAALFALAWYLAEEPGITSR